MRHDTGAERLLRVLDELVFEQLVLLAWTDGLINHHTTQSGSEGGGPDRPSSSYLSVGLNQILGSSAGLAPAAGLGGQ